MPELPSEVILHILSFIPVPELIPGVNFQFYNYYLDARYGSIRIESIDHRTFRLIERLKDPVVARRVRRLVVRPPTLPLAPTGPPHNARATIRRFLSFMTRVAPEWLTVEDIIDSLMLVLPRLGNLTHFEIETWDIPPEMDLQPFFRTAWTAFGERLVSMSIAGRPETFYQFTSSEPRLFSCKHLGLQFTRELDTMASAAVTDILVNSVAPFINGLATQLESLRIWSWSTLDLSTLFLHLGAFPKLRRFHLRAPFNKAFPDPTGLTRLLEDNARTLEMIELRLNPAGSAMDPGIENALAEWFASHSAQPTVLSDLDSLFIYPTTHAAGFTALMMYVGRSAGTLRSLAVKDRYLTLGEVQSLVGPLYGLRTLRLNVRIWDVELFRLLEKSLPGLKSLSLYVGGSHPHRAAVETLFNEMQEQPMSSWDLQDIGVWQGGSEIPLSTMHLLARCIPSVHGFWGNGHMDSDMKIYD
ncbi:unnamed protein product [Mycena citricolor]|uniref:F-box domain-containing protein n=1 Tax=Mycena citricolor TaxID=2018698 RepID=A0AAD2H5F3_9AGAR|nr:unnamed protein product [Mycena citricolor]